MLTEIRQDLDVYCRSYSVAPQPELLTESLQKIQQLGQQLNTADQAVPTLTFLQEEIHRIEDNINRSSESHVMGIKILTNIEKALIDEFLKLSPTEQDQYLSDKDNEQQIHSLIEKLDLNKIRDVEKGDYLFHQLCRSDSPRTRQLSLVCLKRVSISIKKIYGEPQGFILQH